MKKKIILRRMFHRNEWRYAIIFENDPGLSGLVRSVNGSAWSRTKGCWYANSDEKTLKQILTVFRDSADIDISEIVSIEKEVESHPLSDVADITDEDQDTILSYNELVINEFTTQHKKDKTVPRQRYGPVQFTINEPDGRLVIRFTRGYSPEWIDELKTYGKLWYDKPRKEWLLKWSQLTVDSLSDYFSTRGIEVIVKKMEVSEALKEIRIEEGSDVRNRILDVDAVNRIEQVRQYLEEKRYSKRTCESYLSHLELFFKYFHGRDPDRISEEDISQFIDNFIIRLGYSPSYQNLLISAIKMYYSLSGKSRLDPDSFQRPRKRRSLPKVFSKEEVMKIFAATRNNKHKLMLWMIYSCGLRRSEVINIKLTDLDTERGILQIREGKGNVDRMVPIPQKVWEKIRAYTRSYRPRIYLFEGQSGGKYSVESVYSVFKQSLRRAGIKKDVGVHCLRHSYATHLHENGLDIRYIQELLGHKSTRTTEIYTHVSRRNLFAIRSPIEDMDIE